VTLTAKEVAEITRLLEDSTFDELTVELDGLKLTVRRAGAAVASGPPEQEARSAPAPQPRTAAAPPSHSEPASGLPPRSEAAFASEAVAAAQEVSAPLLGTFYRAPKPGAPPFVEVGSVVEEDTIIGIIEVMKLMNTVRAGVCGTVADILAEDGALVEYGQTLLRISKAACS
jgi:acetyl-CoA carboxylase biotin carboxyl carrier protein